MCMGPFGRGKDLETLKKLDESGDGSNDESVEQPEQETASSESCFIKQPYVHTCIHVWTVRACVYKDI